MDGACKYVALPFLIEWGVSGGASMMPTATLLLWLRGTGIVLACLRRLLLTQELLLKCIKRRRNLGDKASLKIKTEAA